MLFTVESSVIEQFGSGVQTILPFCCARGFRVVTKILGRESNSEGFLLVLFFFYFPLKVARGQIRSSWGGNPRPPPLNDSPGVVV